MIYILENNSNKLVASVNVHVSGNDEDDFVEIDTHVNIVEYSDILSSNTNKKSVIEDFDTVAELGDWLWNVRLPGKNQNKGYEYENIVRDVEAIVKEIAEKYNLVLTED